MHFSKKSKVCISSIELEIMGGVDNNIEFPEVDVALMLKCSYAGYTNNLEGKDLIKFFQI